VLHFDEEVGEAVEMEHRHEAFVDYVPSCHFFEPMYQEMGRTILIAEQVMLAVAQDEMRVIAQVASSVAV